MRLDHDFFNVKSSNDDGTNPQVPPMTVEETARREGIEDGVMEDIRDENQEHKWLGKTNFVEVRSFWQIFRSFDRMWSFLLLSLQAMIIMASHDLGSPFQIIDAIILEDVMSIFITSAVLELIKAVLDVVFTWKARNTMNITEKRKYLLKIYRDLKFPNLHFLVLVDSA